jgi:hypothetical protein
MASYPIFCVVLKLTLMFLKTKGTPQWGRFKWAVIKTTNQTTSTLETLQYSFFDTICATISNHGLS